MLECFSMNNTTTWILQQMTISLEQQHEQNEYYNKYNINIIITTWVFLWAKITTYKLCKNEWCGVEECDIVVDYNESGGGIWDDCILEIYEY